MSAALHRLQIWLAALVLLAGCQATTPESAQEEPSFPTKSVAYTTFRFDSFDRKRALNACRILKAHLLFELIIDRQGNVIKLHTLKNDLDEGSKSAFESYVSGMKFTPAPESDPFPYRALFYPVKTKTEIETR